MTRFCIDLMECQAEAGDEVTALWPGRMNGGQPSIRSDGQVGKVMSWELINPLPVPLVEGIWEPAAFMEPCDGSVYREFLSRIRPEIIHIHTLMGLHREFPEEAEKLGIRCVYTVHDFFGICPRVFLFRDGDVCREDGGCGLCAVCSRSALRKTQITLLQSPLYRGLKETAPVRKLRQLHRLRFFEKEKASQTGSYGTELQKRRGEYQALRAYYEGMFEKMRAFHFTSVTSRSVFEKYIRIRNGKVIHITHRDISGRQNTWRPKTGPIRYFFLSGAIPHKGYEMLLSVFDRLWAEGKRDLELHVFGNSRDIRPYMKVFRSGYPQQALGQIMREADVVLVPSLCYETFGFAVPEAISFGVPVIVSDRVGAKEIIGGGGLVFRSDDPESLRQILAGMDREQLERLHRGTMEAELTECAEMTIRIKNWYREVCT